MLLGVGSVINPRELETAIEMGFDMIVGPDSGMGGCRERIDFVKIVRAAKCFGVPGAFSPSEFAYFLEREDGLEPDGIKIFNASVYGPSGVGALLAPYQRERHNGKMVMPTGGVNVKTGAGFQEQISKRGLLPGPRHVRAPGAGHGAKEDRRPGHHPRVAGEVQGRVQSLTSPPEGPRCPEDAMGPAADRPGPIASMEEVFMNSTERLLRVLAGKPVDRAPVIGVTSVVTVDLMRQVGTRWPDAHHDPEQMVRAGAAAHVVCGLESVKVPFDMAVEAGALGADIDYGADTTLPKIRAPLFRIAAPIRVPRATSSRAADIPWFWRPSASRGSNTAIPCRSSRRCWVRSRSRAAFSASRRCWSG